MTRLSLHTLARGLVLVGGGWFLTACSTDALTSPTITSAEAMHTQNGFESSAKVAELTTVSTLARSIPLHGAVSASAVLGPNGGSLSIPSLGVTLEVPSGALESNVRLMITALPGEAIAYDLSPHGISFRVPVRLQQRLSDTNWETGATLEGAKFNNASQVDAQRSSARVNEKLRAWLTASSVSIYVKKFSGYLVSMS